MEEEADLEEVVRQVRCKTAIPDAVFGAHSGIAQVNMRDLLFGSHQEAAQEQNMME
jgi:hypothetical protein